MDADPFQILRALQRSRKYKHLCRQTLLRMANWAAKRHRQSQTEAIKAAKRKLHQVYAAYLTGWDPKRSYGILQSLPDPPAAKQLRDACRRIMSSHTSSAERMEVLAGLYGSIFEITGIPQRVLDIGCGLGPLALPWMGLPDNIEYEAWDIDQRMVELLNRFFEMVAPRSVASCRDILVDTPTHRADVAFCMKLLPCLEQQQPGSSRDLLARLPADFLVVSFPVRSIGGRGKDMTRNYAAMIEPIFAQMDLTTHRLDCQAELVYVVDNRRPGVS